MTGVNLSQKQPKNVSLRLLVIVTTIVFLVVAAAAGFFAMQFFALKSNPSAIDKEITERVVGAVDKLYVLPEGEPTVAKVEDKDKLSSQTFFSQAENGDFVLIYADAQLALLYREGLGKLVNVGPITIDEDKAAPTPDGIKPTGE